MTGQITRVVVIGVIAYRGDAVGTVITVEIVDGKITNFYAMRNPEKLAAVAVRREISR
jgi:RNA polymerase sigma-70 factor (ECF subfamily)